APIEEDAALEARTHDTVGDARAFGEGLQRVAVLHDFEATEKTLTANFRDIRMLPEQGFKPLHQTRPLRCRAGDKRFFFKDLQHLVRSCAGAGMRAISVEHERLPGIDQWSNHLIRRKYADNRRIAARKALAGNHDVWCEAEMFAGEALARAAKADHHFIRDQQYAIAVANLAHFRPVARARHERTAGRARDRFGKKGRYRLRPFAEDRVFECLCGYNVVIRVVPPARRAERIRRRHLRCMGDKLLEPLLARNMPGHTQREECRAMIGNITADDLPARFISFRAEML